MIKSEWVRSSRCETSACVEVMHRGDEVLVRDSKSPESTELTFTPAEWGAFLEGVRQGDFG